MSNYDMQKNIVEAIRVVVDSRLGEKDTTSSKIGFVVEDPLGFKCKVDINGQVFNCQLPEHLHTWIQKNDIVIVQDLHSDGVKKVVTGKTGSKNTTPSIVFYDEDLKRNISGRDLLEDGTGNKIDSFGTIRE